MGDLLLVEPQRLVPKVFPLALLKSPGIATNVPGLAATRARHEEGRSLVLICKMGRNAALAGEKLQKHGYKNTHVLQGGISTWQQEGLPLVKVK